MSSLLRVIKPEEVQAQCADPVDAAAREQAQRILEEVRTKGAEGLLDVSVRLHDLDTRESKLFYTKSDLEEAFNKLDEQTQAVLRRTAENVRVFAQAQRDAVRDAFVAVPGGSAGHSVSPVEVAGCYAPGGRYPLPSSVLMTAVTARVAGVSTVYVASPRPAQATLAAAFLADADGLLAVGGAQAIGALAYGLSSPSHSLSLARCDVIVGPGNKWVTAAKSLVAGVCAIDMLAGPSEVLVVADKSCDPDVVAADLLAQAEHDTEARPILVTAEASVIDAVNERLAARLAVLPTAETAKEAVQKGFAVLCEDLAQAVRVSDVIAPEHLEIHTEDAKEVARRCRHYGAVFIGAISAEVLGDYGVGPNHVLPTGGTARYTGGLSVFTFLRIRTWMHITDKAAAQTVVRDAVALARVEGLEAHARAAECRLLDNEEEQAAKKQKTEE